MPFLSLPPPFSCVACKLVPILPPFCADLPPLVVVSQLVPTRTKEIKPIRDAVAADVKARLEAFQATLEEYRAALFKRPVLKVREHTHAPLPPSLLPLAPPLHPVLLLPFPALHPSIPCSPIHPSPSLPCHPLHPSLRRVERVFSARLITGRLQEQGWLPLCVHQLEYYRSRGVQPNHSPSRDGHVTRLA